MSPRQVQGNAVDAEQGSLSGSSEWRTGHGFAFHASHPTDKLPFTQKDLLTSEKSSEQGFLVLCEPQLAADQRQTAGKCFLLEPLWNQPGTSLCFS